MHASQVLKEINKMIQDIKLWTDNQKEEREILYDIVKEKYEEFRIKSDGYYS